MNGAPVAGHSEPLAVHGLRVAFGARTVVHDVDLTFAAGTLTAIVGPNACGKSTLLRAMARILRPTRGAVILQGADVASLSTKEVARRLGLLPQAPTAPGGVTVADLVRRGRFPHQGRFRQWSEQDEHAVQTALEHTGLGGLERRLLDELSGGQRQRAWLAMALAQEADILLLDEPTTFLDLPHQHEVLDVLEDLRRARGTTIVAVLHDLNQAGAYAQQVVAMRDGSVVAQGTPHEILTEAVIADVYGMAVRVVPNPVDGTPLIVPIRKGGPRWPVNKTSRQNL